jgi:hypothetical protein
LDRDIPDVVLVEFRKAGIRVKLGVSREAERPECENGQASRSFEEPFHKVREGCCGIYPLRKEKKLTG